MNSFQSVVYFVSLSNTSSNASRLRVWLAFPQPSTASPFRNRFWTTNLKNKFDLSTENRVATVLWPLFLPVRAKWWQTDRRTKKVCFFFISNLYKNQLHYTLTRSLFLQRLRGFETFDSVFDLWLRQTNRATDPKLNPNYTKGFPAAVNAMGVVLYDIVFGATDLKLIN